jgi:molybdopterin adenylyltransferase
MKSPAGSHPETAAPLITRPLITQMVAPGEEPTAARVLKRKGIERRRVPFYTLQQVMEKRSKNNIRAVVLTISDSASRGEREDLSGPAVVAELASLPVTPVTPVTVVATAILPDEVELIAAALRSYADQGTDGGAVDLIVTTGGTGFARRDVTPEATRQVIEREAPGLAELMRAESLRITPLAVLSRSVCGIRGGTLIINLPGSVRGARENLQAIARTLPHAISLLRE